MAIGQGNTNRSGSAIRRAAPPPSDAFRVAALIDREGILIDESRFLGEASYRRRQDIEVELCDLRRELERLGFRR
jgi:hypothetical protein